MFSHAKIIALTVTFLAFFLLGLFAGRWSAVPKIQEVQVPLPAKVVTVEKTKEIKVPGPGSVEERIVVQTVEKEVPVETIREITHFVKPTGQVKFTADKYVGLTPAGQMGEGWKGLATCQIKDANVAASPWVTLVEAPFDFSSSRAYEVETGTKWPLMNHALGLGAGVGSHGPFALGDLSFRTHPKNRFTKAVMPDWITTQAQIGQKDAAIAVLGRWEF